MGIYVNQIGYPISGKKVAISTAPCNFQIINASTQSSVFDGVTGTGIMDKSAGEEVYQIDFSEVTTPGSYYILAGNKEKSCTFSIQANTYKSLKTDLLKCLYYQRCGGPVEKSVLQREEAQELLQESHYINYKH